MAIFNRMVAALHRLRDRRARADRRGACCAATWSRSRASSATARSRCSGSSTRRCTRTAASRASTIRRRCPRAVQRAHGRDRAPRDRARSGSSWTLWNIEMMYDAAADRVSIVEVNPRICGQFADLYQKVDGTNSYEIALALCTGARPRFARGARALRRGGELSAARVRAERASTRRRTTPTPPRPRRCSPETLVWRECRTGDELADFARRGRREPALCRDQPRRRRPRRPRAPLRARCSERLGFRSRRCAAR